MPPVAEVLAKAKSVFAFQTTDTIGHLASLAIERGAFASGCDGSRTRKAYRFLRPCLLTQHTLDSFPDYQSANQTEGGRTPFTERVVRQVSGSHKPRPPEKKELGVLASTLETNLP